MKSNILGTNCKGRMHDSLKNTTKTRRDKSFDNFKYKNTSCLYTTNIIHGHLQ